MQLLTKIAKWSTLSNQTVGIRSCSLPPTSVRPQSAPEPLRPPQRDKDPVKDTARSRDYDSTSHVGSSLPWRVARTSAAGLIDMPPARVHTRAAAAAFAICIRHTEGPPCLKGGDVVAPGEVGGVPLEEGDVVRARIEFVLWLADLLRVKGAEGLCRALSPKTVGLASFGAGEREDWKRALTQRARCFSKSTTMAAALAAPSP